MDWTRPSRKMENRRWRCTARQWSREVFSSKEKTRQSDGRGLIIRITTNKVLSTKKTRGEDLGGVRLENRCKKRKKKEG